MFTITAKRFVNNAKLGQPFRNIRTGLEIHGGNDGKSRRALSLCRRALSFCRRALSLCFIFCRALLARNSRPELVSLRWR